MKEYQDDDEKKLDSSRKESFDKSTVLSADAVPQVADVMPDVDYNSDLSITEQ